MLKRPGLAGKVVGTGVKVFDAVEPTASKAGKVLDRAAKTRIGKIAGSTGSGLLLPGMPGNRYAVSGAVASQVLSRTTGIGTPGTADYTEAGARAADKAWQAR